MGMFAFRRAKEREAAAQVASTPVKPTPKKTRKPKATSNGNNDSSDSRSS